MSQHRKRRLPSGRSQRQAPWGKEPARFGNLAALAAVSDRRPLALRPVLSNGLPLSAAAHPNPLCVGTYRIIRRATAVC